MKIWAGPVPLQANRMTRGGGPGHMFAPRLRQKRREEMEFAEDGRKERGQGVFARVLSSKKINAIATYITDTEYELGVLRDQFFKAAKGKPDADPNPYRQLGKALFEMNVESVRWRCAEFPSLRLRGNLTPHYKYRSQDAPLIYVYDAVNELYEQCCLSGDDLFDLLCDLRLLVADNIIETNRELLAGKDVAS